MLDAIIFSFLDGLKSNSFVLDSFNDSFVLDPFNERLLALIQSVSNFSSLFITQDIFRGHLLPNEKIVSPAKW